MISGFTGSGTGGLSGNAALFHPGITESAPQTQFGGNAGPQYLRGAKISYAGYDVALPYKQFSVSDAVSWAAQFAGQGYEDVRQLSQTTLLYSSMLLEERMLLGGRGTDAGFSGALVPTVSVVPRAINTGGHTGETAIVSPGTNIYAQVVGHTTWGNSVLTAAASVASGSGVVDVTVTNAGTSGGLSYDIYVGTGSTAPATSAMWLAGTTNGNKFVIQGALPTSGTNAVAAAAAADTTANASGYDGILAYCTGSQAGSVSELNGPLSVANPGDEFNQVFANLYDSVKADPDEILANGHDRKQLSDTLKAASGNSYRITVDNAGQAHDARIGALVTGVQNEVTGKMVDITVHPWLAQGVMPVISWTLPLPDSQVSDCFAVYNVQDYMGIQWPVNQFLYEASSYWFGTFLCYAPAWQGAVIGITKV